MVAISVVMPVYNTSGYLVSSIESVLNQTFQDFELICVDDGSTDDSPLILAQYVSKDKRIKVITQQNQGQSAARNCGLDCAKGDYIFFLDSDDKLHEKALEMFYKIAFESKAPIVVSTKFIKMNKPACKMVQKSTFGDFKICSEPLRELFAIKYLSSLVWNKLYKRECLADKRFTVGFPFEDWSFITKLFSDISFFAATDTPVYYYNNLNISTVRSPFTAKKVMGYMVGIDEVSRYFARPDKLEMWPIVRKKRIKKSLKMVLSKIIKSGKDKAKLAQVFFASWNKLEKNGKVSKHDLSFKSLLRFYYLKWIAKREDVLK